MEKKKKKKIVITISIIATIVIVLVVGLFFILKNVKNNKNDKNSASNVNMTNTEQKYQEAQNAIIRGEIPYDYNGNYSFSHIGNVSFNEKLSDEQIKLILSKQGVKDINSLINKLYDKKTAESKNHSEIIVLNNGKFTRSYNETQKTIIEYGIFRGNNDLCDIRIKNKTTNTHDLKYRMSLTYTEELVATTGSENEEDSTKVYFFKDFCNDNGDVLMTVTYVYSRLKDTTNIIPNTDLDFDI